MSNSERRRVPSHATASERPSELHQIGGRSIISPALTLPAALNQKGVRLGELKRYDEALQAYDQALQFRPHYSEALYNRGNALVMLQRYDEAIQAYDQALQVRPDYPEALKIRDYIRAELKRTSTA